MKKILILLALTLPAALAQKPEVYELIPALWNYEGYPGVSTYTAQNGHIEMGEDGTPLKHRIYEAEIVTESGELIPSDWSFLQDKRTKHVMEVAVETRGTTSNPAFEAASRYMAAWIFGGCFGMTDKEAQGRDVAAWYADTYEAAVSQGQGKYARTFDDLTVLFELTYHNDGFHRLYQEVRRTGTPESWPSYCKLEKLEFD